MSKRPPFDPDDRSAQTVRSVRALLALGVACALFVAVAISAVRSPADPPVAAQAPDLQTAADATVPGA